MLYGNMQQMAKLSVFIFTLLAWIDYSREFIIKKHKKMPQNLPSIFKINLKEMHH